MREEFEKIYQNSLNLCKEPAEDFKLDFKMHTAHCMMWKMLGMLQLMAACGEISQAEDEELEDKITKDFNTVNLYGAYMEDGEIMVLAQKEGEYETAGGD